MSGLVKAKEYNWKDSNVARINSKEDRQVSRYKEISKCSSFRGNFLAYRQISFDFFLQLFSRSRKIRREKSRLGKAANTWKEQKFGGSKSLRHVLIFV